MKDTSGRSFSVSSTSIDLQSSLESKLRALMAGRGSTLYSLIWKHWTLQSQQQICTLRASVRRTSDSACTGWPSPTANDAKDSAYSYSHGNHDKKSLKLLGVARTAGWPTPRAQDGRKGALRSENRRGNTGHDLPTAARRILGPGQSGSIAQTECAGLLNPEFSRWLMGYPRGWIV